MVLNRHCRDWTIAEASRRLAGARGDSRGELLECVADELAGHLDRQVLFEEFVEELGPWTERRAYAQASLLAVRTTRFQSPIILGRIGVRSNGARRARLPRLAVPAGAYPSPSRRHAVIVCVDRSAIQSCSTPARA